MTGRSRPRCELLLPATGSPSWSAALLALLAPLVEVTEVRNTALPATVPETIRLGLAADEPPSTAEAELARLRPVCRRVALMVPHADTATVGAGLAAGWDAVLGVDDPAEAARWVLGEVLHPAPPADPDASRFRAVFDEALDGIFVVDGNTGRVLAVNPAAEVLLGYPAGNLLEFPFRLLFSSADAKDSTVSLVKRLQRTGVEFRSEEFRRLDGTTVELDLTARMIHWGGREAMLVELRDSRELIAAHHERDRFRAAFEECAQAMLILDRAGRVQYVNHGFEQTTGFTRAEVAGRDVQAMLGVAVDPMVIDDILQAIREGRVWRGVVAARRHSGGESRYRVTAGPVHDDRGRLQGGYVTGDDVTEEALLVESSLEAQKREDLGRLATAIAHDFNNILTVVMGTASMALESAQSIEVLGPEDDAERRQVVDSLRLVLDSSERATDLTRQLLTTSIPATGARLPVDVGELARDIERFVRRLMGDRIEVAVDVEPGRQVVEGDRAQLHQVIVNLAVNAREAMPAGGRLTITVDGATLDHPLADPRIEAGRYVRVAVQDTGVGIPDEVRLHIFEPYFTTRGRHGGHGIGLATVRQIVEQHGGALALQTRVGQGTCFTIWLPRTNRLVVATPKDVTPILPPAPFRARILLVEDDVPLRQLMTRALGRMGHTVIECYDGVHALECLAGDWDSVDAVVLDYSMPRLNGTELAERLRAHRPELPLVFISGYGADDLPAEWRQAPHTAGLSKPFTPIRLAATVRRLVEANRT